MTEFDRHENSFWKLILKQLTTRMVLLKRYIFPSILMVGTVLRLCKWNGYSFWHDEILWLMVSRKHLMVTLKENIYLLKPPLFKVLVYIWTYFGQDEFTLRLLPSIFGILSIIAIYKMGEVLFDKKVGLIAAFIIAISPFHIYYSQELTDYSLTMFLALCSMYYFVNSLEKNNIYSWINFIVFTTLSLYANYISVFLLAATIFFFLASYIKYKHLAKRWLLSELLIVLLYFPWIIRFPLQLYFISSPFLHYDWISKGSLFHVIQALRLFNVGYNANFITQTFAALLFFPLVFIGIVSYAKKETRRIMFLTLWLFGPMILSVLFSKIVPTFSYRNFILSLPAYYILVAAGAVKLKRFFYLSLPFFITLSVLSLSNYYNNIFPYPEKFYRPGVHAKKDARVAAQCVMKNSKEGDVVVHANNSTIFPYIYYRYRLDGKDTRDFNDFIKNLYNLSLIEEHLPFDWGSRFLLDRPGKISEFIHVDSKRMWFIFSSWEPQELASNQNLQENKIRKFLADRYKLIDHKKFTGIEVYLYDTSSRYH